MLSASAANAAAMKECKFRAAARFVLAFLSLLAVECLNSPLLAAQQMSDDERQLFESVNRERAANLLPALEWDEALAKAATLHARRMAFYNVMEHQLSGEPDLEARLTEAGARFGAIAENIGLGATPQIIHDGWMHSPGHKGNILSPKMTAIGIAVVRTNVGMFAVQDFTLSVSSLSLEEQEKKVSGLLTQAGWQVASGSKDDARKACETDQIDSRGRVREIYLVRFETSDLSQIPQEVEKKMRSKPYRNVSVGACQAGGAAGFAHFRIALLLY